VLHGDSVSARVVSGARRCHAIVAIAHAFRLNTFAHGDAALQRAAGDAHGHRNRAPRAESATRTRCASDIKDTQ